MSHPTIVHCSDGYYLELEEPLHEARWDRGPSRCEVCNADTYTAIMPAGIADEDLGHLAAISEKEML